MQTSITAQNDHSDNAMIHQVDNASSSMHRAIDRASNAAGPAIDGLAASAHEATNRMAMTASHAAATMRASSDRLRVAQNQFAQNCSGYVREKPLTSLGIAVAGGFLLGMMLWLTRKSPARH